VSSEKHETVPDPGVVGQGGHTAGVGTAAIVIGGYYPLPDPLAVSSRLAKSAKSLRLRTLWRLYSCDTLLEWLSQDLQDVAAELRQFIQKEHAVVRQRHFARHRHMAPADQPDIRDGVMGVRHGRGGTKAMRSPGRLVSIPSCTRIVDMPMKRPYT
jgi:hypothetical protein